MLEALQTWWADERAVRSRSVRLAMASQALEADVQEFMEATRSQRFGDAYEIAKKRSGLIIGVVLPLLVVRSHEIFSRLSRHADTSLAGRGIGRTSRGHADHHLYHRYRLQDAHPEPSALAFRRRPAPAVRKRRLASDGGASPAWFLSPIRPLVGSSARPRPPSGLHGIGKVEATMKCAPYSASLSRSPLPPRSSPTKLEGDAAMLNLNTKGYL